MLRVCLPIPFHGLAAAVAALIAIGLASIAPAAEVPPAATVTMAKHLRDVVVADQAKRTQSAVDADRRVHFAEDWRGQISGQEQSDCMACAILSACAHLGIRGDRLCEKDLAWDLGTLPDAGVTMPGTMPVIQRILSRSPWMALYLPRVESAQLCAPGAISIVAQANPGRYCGHVVTTRGLGPQLGVMVNDSRDESPRYCDPAAMRVAFAGPAIVFFHRASVPALAQR